MIFPGTKRRETEIAAFGEVLEALDEIVGFALGRQNPTEPIQIELVVADVLFETRQVSLGRQPLLDLAFELVDMILRPLAILFDGLEDIHLQHHEKGDAEHESDQSERPTRAFH